MSVLDELDSGDILLFDRKCLAMMNPLSTSICGMAKLASRFDHVAIVLKLDSTVDEDSAIRKAISERSPRDLYVLEANLNGITIRSLEKRISRSSSNAIAVRKLLNVVRDVDYHRKFNQHTETLLDFKYRDQVSDLITLSLDPPDKAFDRETARHLLQIRAQIEGIHKLRGPHAKENTVLASMEKDFARQYNELAAKVQQPTLAENEDKTVVCSEVVASCLQAVGVLALFPSYSSYLPRDFDARRSEQRIVFVNPSTQLSPLIYLSGSSYAGKAEEAVASSQLPVIKSKDELIELPTRASRTDLTKPLLQISQAYMFSTLVTAMLYCKQVQLQLRWTTLARGSLLTFTGVTALRIATASSLHVQLAHAFDGNVRNYFTSSAVDLGHPFYDVVLRGGALGIAAGILTLPIEMLNVRFHFYHYRRWWALPMRSCAGMFLLSSLATTSYCGAFCWPMVYESLIPMLLPLVPSLFRGPTTIKASQEEIEHQRTLGIKFALGISAAQQIVTYPLDTMRMRYSLDPKPTWRNPFLGFRHFMLRGAATFGISYYMLS